MLPKTQITSLSLGGGIQSTALALLLEAGIASPKPDLAVFADTMAEPPHVYETIAWLKPQLSFPILTPHNNLAAATWQQAYNLPSPGHPTGDGYMDIPIYRKNTLSTRQCTANFKIRAIKHTILDFAGLPPHRLAVKALMGISLDEVSRVKDSREKYITHVYPLIDLRFSRGDCQAYLDRHFPNHPTGRSACYFCPFRSTAEWDDLRKRYPNLYADALALDRQLQSKGKSLHRTLNLEKAMQARAAQAELWPNECEGHCGV